MKAKRLIAALLCFLLIGSMIPVSAFAAGGVIGRYTLTLDENWEGGTGQVIPNITSYELPSAARPGATFYGWTLSPDGNAKYNAGDTVTLSHDLTLYAVWHNVTDNGYYVIFDANGGMGTMESIWFGTQSNSPPATIPDCGFTRDGYTFIGWATSPDGAVAYLPGASYKSHDDLFLFAVWEPNDYHTVAFDATGGSVTPASGTTNADGKLASLPMPTKSGYIFCGWYDAPTGGNCVTTATVFTADSTIYAHWAGGGVPQEGYSLTLDENWEGGAVRTIPNVSFYVLPSVMRRGYVLDGWSTDPAGSVEYRENGIITLTADTTLYALWSKSNAPTLILNENWEFGRVRTIPNVSSYELPSVARSGETFYGWANAPDGMVRYRAGDTVTLTHNLTLYAIWWAQNYSIYHVIFDANGGTGTMENLWGGVAGADDVSIPVTIPDCGFTREGYTFKGWATSPTGAVAYLPGASYKSPDDLFLFAVWEQNDYHTVTVNNDGNGTATADKASYEKGETVTLTATPDTGYHFKEWQSSDVTITDNSFTMPEKDVTVKAVFEADAPTTYTGTGWYLDADGVLHITGDISESGFNLTSEQRLQVKSVVAESGASISSGYSLFYEFRSMVSADLSELDTSSVGSMIYMFYDCSSLTSLDLSSFDTSSVNDMSSMFARCSSLTSLDVSGFKTDSLMSADDMFLDCSSLTSLGIRPDILYKNADGIIAIRSPWQKKGSTDTYSTADELKAVTDTVTLLAMYTVNVQNDGNGTASANPAAAVKGDTVTLTATPNTGYHFKEWQSSDVTVNNNSFTMPAKAVTVTAVFEAIPTYAVTFDMNGHGTQITAQSVESGSKATKPADPTASGWTFGGWYADATFSARFDFDTAITANTTAYAKWTKNSAAPADPTSPQTGDTSDMFLWIALLLVSGGALVGTTVYSRKKKTMLSKHL